MNEIQLRDALLAVVLTVSSVLLLSCTYVTVTDTTLGDIKLECKP